MDLENEPNYNWGHAHAKGLVVLTECLDVFSLRAVVTGGKANPSGNLSFTKRNLIGWMSRSCTQRDVIALVEGLCDLGGHFG
jgi:hypothetical protein